MSARGDVGHDRRASTSRPAPFRAIGDSGDEYVGDVLVIATGAQAKWLGVPGEQELGGQGRFRLRHVRRVLLPRQDGRGDRRRQHRGRGSALPDPPRDEVTLIHRRDACGPRKSSRTGCSPIPRSKSIWNKRVERFLGDRGPGADRPRPHATAHRRGQLRDAEGAFVAIGHAPATELFKGQLEMDEGGYIVVEPGTPKTNSRACSRAAT